MVKLIIEDDEGKTTVVPLIRDEITIGRKEGNTIRLTERNVSRRHAKLLKQNGAIFIEDLNSYNGIKVNGNRISGRVAVAEGDRIQIGDYVLGLKLEGVVEASGDPFSPGQTVKLPKQSEAPTAQIEGPAQEAVERADTEAEAEAPPSSTEVKPENMGRLVCLSNNFPGEEWVLDKPIMVVGRTEDNDIVVNHRSISRHHSRITEENGRYTIVDMQSSNGVRVNGEEYGKVELRRGDLIDLGHVRLRFVAAGEDFVFSRDASVVDISKSGPSRGGIYAAIVVVALVAVGIVVWRLSSTGTPGKATPDIQSGTPGTEPHTGPASKPEVEPAAQLLSKISDAIGREAWEEAIEACGKLTDEAKVDAEVNCTMAKAEKKAFELFEEARKANIVPDYLKVIEARAKIPEDSIYKKRDLHVLENAKKQYLAQARKQLDDAVRSKDCDQAREIAGKIKTVEPTDDEAENKAARCDAVAVRPPAKVRKPRTPRTPRVRPKTKRPPPKVVVPPAPPTNPLQNAQAAKAKLKQARQSYIAGKHSLSITQAREVLRLSPNNTDAIQIIGAASCYLKQQQQAKWAYNKLRPASRALVRSICMRNGINLE
jgi:pSer/pThr/pTyr-binding forkhead associated (FHA) protein